VIELLVQREDLELRLQIDVVVEPRVEAIFLGLAVLTHPDDRGPDRGAARERPTTLVIAHRYSMVEGADHVIVLEAGRVVDQGTPADLIARGGWFARFAAGNVGHVEARVEDSDGGRYAGDDDGLDSEGGGAPASSVAEDTEDRFPKDP
jgi:hypothetical protein